MRNEDRDDLRMKSLKWRKSDVLMERMPTYNNQGHETKKTVTESTEDEKRKRKGDKEREMGEKKEEERRSRKKK